MAGISRPPIVGTGLRKEITWTVNANSGGQGSGGTVLAPALLNGIAINQWNTANVFYWSQASDLIDITLDDDCNIWRSGTTSWANSNAQIRVYKWDGASWSTLSVPQVLTAITEFQWEKTISSLTKGRYKFGWIGIRLDSEWYLEGVNTPLVYGGILRSTILSMNIGDYIPCRYTALTSGIPGVFSELGTCVANEIPIAGTATPDGLFYLIHSGYDTKDKIKLIPDRNLQTSISWNALNTAGIASGSMMEVLVSPMYNLTMRLLTGGTSATNFDNEWDKIIAGSTLNGNITAGDNGVWNWNGITSWTSTTGNTSANRVSRGNALVTTTNAPTGLVTTTVNATTGFRPIMLVEIFISINSLLKTFINNNKQIQLTATSISDVNLANKIKYQVTITKPDSSIVVKRAYDTTFQNNPMAFDTLLFDILEFDIGINIIKIDTIDDQTPPATGQSIISVIKSSVLKSLLQDGIKWKYINENVLTSVITDYTTDTIQNKENAFLTNGMGLTIGLTPVLNSLIENRDNFKIVIDKAEGLS